MRTEFTNKVRAEASLRAKDKCEKCNANIKYKPRHFDHDIPADLGGTNDLNNCSVLCIPCHKAKTKSQDMPRITKGRRIRRREAGIKKPRTIRAWRKFDGTPVHASRHR